MEIQFTTHRFREGTAFVAYSPELDVSSCGDSPAKAFENLNEAMTLFLEEAGGMGTLDQILDEAGFAKKDGRLEGPQLTSTKTATIRASFLHALDAVNVNV